MYVNVAERKVGHVYKARGPLDVKGGREMSARIYLMSVEKYL
jgi:hypothetical protein